MYADEVGNSSSEDVRRTPDEGNGYIGEFSTDYINMEIFKLFDVRG